MQALPMLTKHDFRLAVAMSIAVLLFPTNRAAVCAAETVPVPAWPSPQWQSASPAEAGLDSDALESAKQYALSAGGSGMVVHRGLAVVRWGDQAQRYDIKSATKSIGAVALGIAIKDGKIDLQAVAQSYHPSLGVPPESDLQTSWLSEITIEQLATHTAGFDKPGGYQKLLFRPGTRWHYSDAGPNWLAECITLQYQQDLEDLMFQRVFSPIGISRDDLRWRPNQYRPHQIDGIARREFGAGIHANVDALARIGYLHLRVGRWEDQQILAEDFVHLATRPIASLARVLPWDAASHGNAPAHYGLLWWNNADGALPQVPRDAYWAWGLHDSLILVIPSLDLVVARGGAAGKSWPRDEKSDDHYQPLVSFFDPIVAAVKASQRNGSVSQQPSGQSAAPYPPSPLITDIQWAPKESIIRLAKGSDNWPLTWANDGHLYTAYGDGWGFEPRTEKKLSLGLARVEGVPPHIKGINIRSGDAERVGEGAHGGKASGMLMVNDTLYMIVRNVGNSQLAWSENHGQSWTWAAWKWSTSFGCPTFLNFGKNYAGAKDGFVYVYSSDSNSAYQSADQMVLARVPRDRVQDQDAYEYFKGMNSENEPAWTLDIEQRQAIFKHPQRCYRSGITYNAVLDRYLWCQVYPESTDRQGPRFQGGFGIYDAPTPWGPWTTVYHTDNWDVGPGETSSFPSKWISADGRSLYLVFSGDDCFSVRQARLKVRP
jgi:CubicO group peptidase (beta-lactamase class C family)